MFKKVFVFGCLVMLTVAALAQEIKLGERSVNLTAYLQTRYALAQSGNDTFSIPRLRADIWGDVNDWTSYFFELDAVTSPAIIYGWADLKPNKFTKFSIGRFYYPFGLEYTTPPSKFDTINPTAMLWALYGYSRDTGIELTQNFDKFKYYLALVNGADNQAADDNEGKDLVGRFLFIQSKDLTAGFSLQSGKTGTLEAKRERIGVELNYKAGAFGLKGEGIEAYDAGIRKLGWYLQPSLFLTPALQALMRFEEWDPDIDLAGNRQTVTTLGVNAFFNPETKLQINYEAKREEIEVNNDQFLFQFQLNI